MCVEVYIEKCRDGAVMPSYARPGDAGMDVCCAEDTFISPGETKIVPTGLRFAIPEGYEIQVRPRSGVSLKTPLRIANAPGTIDSGYRDELGIIVTNSSVQQSGGASFTIKNGDRIAQIVLQRVPRMKLITVDSVTGIGMDRGGGFGSTGFR